MQQHYSANYSAGEYDTSNTHDVPSTTGFSDADNGAVSVGTTDEVMTTGEDSHHHAQNQGHIHQDQNGEFQSQRRNQEQHQQQQQQTAAATGPVNTSSRGAFRVVEGMNLYVSQLPPSYNSTRLREVFSQFGAIHSAKVMHDARTNESRCFGFVLFERSTDGECAIAEMSGVILEDGGNRLQIRVARPTALPQPLRDDAAAEGGEFAVKSPLDAGARASNGFGSNDGDGDGDDYQYGDQFRNNSNNRNIRNANYNNHNNFNHHNNNNHNNSRRAQNFQQQQQQQFSPSSSAPPSHLSSPLDNDMMMPMMMPMAGMMPMAPMPFGAMYPAGGAMMAPYMMMPNAGYSMMPSPNVYYVPTAFAPPTAGGAGYPLMPATQQGGAASGGTSNNGSNGYLPSYQAASAGQWPNQQQQQQHQ